ncbi:hypothetical protein PFISCL1PPCAC_2763, partial [Pristionchus fissidentatus]
SLLLLLALFPLFDAQCTGNDAPQCASWQANGFCTNPGYSSDYKKLYCGVRCGLCNRDGTQTSLGGGSNYTACNDTATEYASF